MSLFRARLRPQYQNWWSSFGSQAWYPVDKFSNSGQSAWILTLHGKECVPNMCLEFEHTPTGQRGQPTVIPERSIMEIVKHAPPPAPPAIFDITGLTHAEAAELLSYMGKFACHGLGHFHNVLYAKLSSFVESARQPVKAKINAGPYEVRQGDVTALKCHREDWTN
jgi:hypothetical protein